MDPRHPVQFSVEYPDRQLNRVTTLFRIFMVIPILFTGPFPRGLFDDPVGVERWTNRVLGSAIVLVTDRYPPFTLGP